MELVAALRLLWRHRIMVLLAALVAVLVGLSMAYRIGFPPKLESRHYTVGIGSVTALVDTPNSQVVDLGGDTGSDIATLSARASLLASLMTSSPIKDQIAERAGISSDDLIAAAPDATGAGGDAIGKGGDDQQAHILKASIANLDSGQIPIISVRTQAPDAAAAAALANASVGVLQEHILSLAGTDNVPKRRRVVVRQLGPARSATVSRGPSPVIGLLVGIVVFGFGCATIVSISALVGGWRRAAALETLSADDHAPVDEPAGEIAPPGSAAARLAALDLVSPRQRDLGPEQPAAAHAEAVPSWLTRGT